MEYFDCMSLAQICFELFQGGNITMKQIYLCFGIAGGLYLICIVFGGIGLSAMAKRQGIKGSWMGFLPFGNTYFAGKVAGEANFFGQKMKRAGLYAMLAEFASVFMNALYMAAQICLQPYIVPIVQNDITLYKLDTSLVPGNMMWLADGAQPIAMVGELLSFVQIVFLCVVFTALFRKYYARSPFIMTVLSAIFPFRGFVLFAVRNNTPVDYNEYIRKRAEQFMRGQQAGTGNPYAGQNGGQYGAPPQDSPFSDFGNTPNGGQSGSSGAGDPFGEFSSPNSSDGGSGNGKDQ